MRPMNPLFTGIFKAFVLFLIFSKAFSIKETFNQASQGLWASYLVKAFGMAKGGQIILTYSMDITSSSTNPTFSSSSYSSYLLLLILTEQQRTSWYSPMDSQNAFGAPSVLSSSDITTLCQQPSFRRIYLDKPIPSGQYNFTIDDSIGGANKFSVLAMQCRYPYLSNLSYNSTIAAGVDVVTNLQVQLEMNNRKPYSSDVTQLSIQVAMLDSFYKGAGIVYALLFLMVLVQLFYARPSVKMIHLLFAITVFATFILSITEYSFYNSSSLGKDTLTSHYFVNIFTAIVDTLSLSTIFLLALGWTLLYSQLLERQKRLVLYSMILYFIFAMGTAVCLDSESTSCQGVYLVEFIMRNLLLLAIIVAMNFTVTQMRILLTHSPWVPSTPIQYARCKQFQLFRSIFILYLFMPTIIYIVQTTTLTWKEAWIVTVMNELTEIIFYFFIGATFSPLHEAMLLRAFDGSINARTE